MKKNVIALMLVLPLLFVFTVFSSGNVASLGVSVSVNGVEILNSPQNDTLHVDLANYNNDFTLDVKVTPENASDKKVSFVVEEVSGSAFADVSVSEAGVVTAKSTGIARISAVTNDGGYRDSITVNVTSSKPYGMNVALYGLNGEENLLTPTANGYTAQVTTGTYRYETSLYPEGYGVKAEVQSGFAVIDGNAGTLLLPFDGETVVDFYYDNGAFGVIRKRVTLSVRQSSESGLTVNGEESCTLALEQGSTSCAFYVQAQQSPVVKENAYVQGFSVQQLQQNCYKVTVGLSPDATDTVLEVAVGDKTAFVHVVYAEFAFSVRGDVAVTDDSAVVLAGSPVTFYAVAEVAAENVTYLWSGDGLQLDVAQDGASCTVTAAQAGSYSLTVTALKNGVAMDIYPVTLSVQAVVPVSSPSTGSELGPTMRLPWTVGATSTPLPLGPGHWKITWPTRSPSLLSSRKYWPREGWMVKLAGAANSWTAWADTPAALITYRLRKSPRLVRTSQLSACRSRPVTAVSSRRSAPLRTAVSARARQYSQGEQMAAVGAQRAAATWADRLGSMALA